MITEFNSEKDAFKEKNTNEICIGQDKNRAHTSGVVCNIV
jgi:hypothetical protein